MQIAFALPDTVLRDADPAEVGLDPGPVAEAVARLAAGGVDPVAGEAAFPGAVGLMGHGGRVVARRASGHALLWADADTLLPPGQRVPMTTDTVCDLASCSKLFTAVAAMQLVEDGRLDLDEPVATHLPEFAAGGKAAVTVRQLLTHTSGLPAELFLWRDHPDPAGRLAAVMAEPLVREPGTAHLYSDLGPITLGVLVERLSGTGLDTVVSERVTGPLGMTSTGYRPAGPRAIAATEHQVVPPRGMVRGEVHDENAWSLGGVAGHAGVFSTVDDLAVLCQTVLNGGTYRGRRILAEGSVRAMASGGSPGEPHGLGFEIDQEWFMGGLSGPATVGHTGYTGTSVVVDLARGSFAVLLTNRVHPSRHGPSVNPARRAWAEGLARARSTPVPTGS